jgi:hypothetical protein
MWVLLPRSSELQNITTQKNVLLIDTVVETSEPALVFKVLQKYYLKNVIYFKDQVPYIIT